MQTVVQQRDVNWTASVAQIRFLGLVWFAMAKATLAIEAIVKHHQYHLKAAAPLDEKTFSDATFLGKLVQLARPSIEARLLCVRFAHRFAAAAGRMTMRELRQMRTCLNPNSEQRYLNMRDMFGGTVKISPRRIFGEGHQEEMRDLLEVQSKDLLYACVLYKRAR